MVADFRSDTLTKPSRGMLDAMLNAEVGDDVWESDPTVKELESKTATLFGMRAALFCPSGTMANQIAIRLFTQPQDEVICDSQSHIYHYESAGPASNSGVALKLIQSQRGIIDARQIEKSINPKDVHFPPSRLVVLENTCNKGGGYSYELDNIREISELCTSRSLSLHMDGARAFNAIVSKGYSSEQLGSHLDSISICLSKGLGCPVGTVLVIKDPELLFKAKRIRKAFGGGMRQSGYLAAAGIYALENNIERLTEDHENAKTLWKGLKEYGLSKEAPEPETNILIFTPGSKWNREELIKELERLGVLSVPMGDDHIRLVTHLDVGTSHIDYALKCFKSLS